jgi:hypothetical protein
MREIVRVLWEEVDRLDRIPVGVCAGGMIYGTMLSYPYRIRIDAVSASNSNGGLEENRCRQWRVSLGGKPPLKEATLTNVEN